MQLRPYQQQDVDKLRELFLSHRRVLYVLSTGGGKTVVFSHIASKSADKNKKIVIVVHRQELLIQASTSIAKFGIRHNLIAAPKIRNQCLIVHADNGICGMLDNTSNIYVASVNMLHKKKEFLSDVDLLVIDEAHHAVAGMWLRCIQYAVKARVLGVTATPERLDGKGLGVVFSAMHEGISMAELIDSGYLAEPYIFTPSTIEKKGVKMRFGDYIASDIEKLVNNRIIVGSVISQYKQKCEGLPTLVYCCTVKHAETVAEEFREAGYRFYSIDGSMDSVKRAAMIKALGNGQIDGLTSCNVVSEGTDIPIVSVGILLRLTASLTLYMQQCGRILRKYPGKERAIIIDHVGNFYTHGFPQEPREWSLELGAKIRKEKKERDVKEKTCPSCFLSHMPAPKCPYCGHEYFFRDLTPDTVEGELEEVRYSPDWAKGKDILKVPYKELMKLAKSREQLEEVAKVKGYKPAWVDRAYKAKQAARARYRYGE